MEIKKGEYVRRDNGIIYKAIDNFTENKDIPKKYAKLISPIVKHSKNIIDLIELEDIVKWKDNKGYYGINEVITRPETGDILGVYAEEADCLFPLKDIEILEILTKEKYQENCYKVEE